MRRIGDLTNPQIAPLYSHVPADRLEQFQNFRREFPYKTIDVQGELWPYLTGGQGDPPILMLSGALAIPDISWTTIVSFAKRRCLIVPAYPPVSSMDALVDGIAAILRSEGVGQAHVMGGSYGGFVAQVFVRRHPDLSRSLILSHTQPPYPELAVRMRRFARYVRWLPMGMVRMLMHRTFQSMIPEQSDDTACLIAIYNELIEYALNKDDIAAIMLRMADYSKRLFAPDDLSGWPGKVLLVYGEADPATPPEVRERLESLYPDAQVHLFAGSGHTTSVSQQGEYLSVIDGFLSQS